MLVAPILWPAGLAPCVPMRLCLLRLFIGPLGWRPVFLCVSACCAYSLALWAGALCSYAFVLVAPIPWTSWLAPCVPIRLCLLRLFSGPLGSPCVPTRLCLLRLFSCPLGWRPVFLSVCACSAYSLALWVGALCSYPFVLVAPILWPSGLAPSLPIFFCLLGIFSSLMGWRPVFLSICACCAYSLALWARALCSYPFVLVAPILCPSGLAPCVPMRLCLLRLFSGPLGWRPVFLSVCAASIPWTFGLAPCLPIRLCLLRLFSDPLGWRPLFLSVRACCAYSLALWAGALRSYAFLLVAPILWSSGWCPVFLCVCACCAYSLALWAGALCSYLFVLVAPILWPSGLAPCVPIRLCLLRPLGWRPVFLRVCACCAYSLALWAGALCSYFFLLVAPILLWPSGLAPCVPIRLCLLRLFSGPLGWRPVFLSVCAASIPWTFGLAPSLPIRLCLLRLFSGPLGWRPVFLSVCVCCAYSLALWAGALCSYAFVLVAPILWPSGLAPCVPIRFCLLRLFFSGPLGWRPVFLSVCACCAYSLALWAGALCSYPFVLRLFPGPLGWHPVFLSVCMCCAYSLTL